MKTSIKNTTLFLIFLCQCLFISSCYTIHENRPGKSIPRIEKYGKEELQIRSFIVEKFNPGSCYGTRAPKAKFIMNSILADTSWISYLKNRFNIDTDSDIYVKSEQLESLKLTKTKLGYIIEFFDGQCCTENIYKGIVIYENGTIEKYDIKIVKTRKVPCF